MGEPKFQPSQAPKSLVRISKKCHNRPMKEILVNLRDGNTDKKLFSQALKALSMGDKDTTYFIQGTDQDVSLFSSYSKEIVLLKGEGKEFAHKIVDQEEGNALTTFHVYKSFGKKFVLLTSSDASFSDFLALNPTFSEDFFLFEDDEDMKEQASLQNDPHFRGFKKIEDVFYDDTHLVLVSAHFLRLFNAFLLSVSNYFSKRQEIKNSSGGFLANLSKNLFSWGAKEENVGSLFQDLTSKFIVEHTSAGFTLLFQEGNTAYSFMNAMHFFLGCIDGKLDFKTDK